MSFDLMVFEVDEVPKKQEEFLVWYSKLCEWGGAHSYNELSVSSKKLQAWFAGMIKEYPAMNGPFGVSEDQIDDPKVTDYSIDRHAIYAAFSWSEAEDAFFRAMELAQDFGLGFFDPQSDVEGIFFIDPNGKHFKAFEKKSFLEKLLGRK